MRARIYKIVQLTWACLVIFFLAYYLQNNLGNLQYYELKPQLSWLALAVTCELIRRLLAGVRWFLVSTPNRDGIGWLEVFEHFHTFFVSNLAMYIPGTVWYVMSRVHLGRQKGHSALKVSMSLIYETALMVWSGTVVGSYLIVTAFKMSSIQMTILLCALGGVSIVLIHPAMVNAGLRMVCTALRRPVSKVETTFQQGCILLLVSLSVWVFGGASLYCISRAMMPDLVGTFLPYVTSLYAMGWVIGFLTPWAPAGIGIRDGIFVWGLNAYMVAPFPVLVAIISRLITLVPDLFWAGLASVLRAWLPRSPSETE